MKKYPVLNVREGSHDPWPAIDQYRGIDPYRHRMACQIIKNNRPLSSQIVDVGCGDGILIGMLAEEGFRNLYGIDHSLEGLRRTHDKYPYVTTLRADLTELEMLWPKYTFDVAVCTEVLEHLPRDLDIPHVMALIYGALAPGGLALISIPDDNICDIDDDHRRLFNPGDEVSILNDAGFVDVVQVQYKYSDRYPRPWMFAMGFKP